MLLIGVAGQKYNGKDTIADYLVSEYGFIKLSFADALKEMCKVLFNFNDEQLYGSEKESIDDFWGIKPRDAFTYFGTDIMRKQLNNLIPNINENFWIKCLEKKMVNLKKNNENIKIVIADVRFENEVNFIKSYNGLIIRVIRPDKILYDCHESEKNILDLSVDYEIMNNSTLNHLYQQVNKIIKLL